MYYVEATMCVGALGIILRYIFSNALTLLWGAISSSRHSLKKYSSVLVLLQFEQGSSVQVLKTLRRFLNADSS